MRRKWPRQLIPRWVSKLLAVLEYGHIIIPVVLIRIWSCFCTARRLSAKAQMDLVLDRSSFHTSTWKFFVLAQISLAADSHFSTSQQAVHTPLLASSLALSLLMPMLAPVITTIFLGSCTFVLQIPPAKNFLMDRAITYRKERREVSSPKITSIFSTSLVAAALPRTTLTPTLARGPPGLAPTLGCFLLLLFPPAPLAPGCSATAWL